jgi:Rieske Fe-S protein
MIDPRDAEERTVAPDGRPAEQQPGWRGDFPIDWPQDQYVARRDFTKFMVLTSFAFVLGQIWIGVRNWFRSRRASPAAKKVATLKQVRELAPGEALPFRYPGEDEPCLLLRLPDDGGKPRYVAYDQRCTHLSCGVIPAPGAPDRLFCPCHHGYFDCATGRPIAGPPRRPLPVIELEERHGDLYAVGVKERTV